MVMQLEKVVPFGRSMDEHPKMFALTEEDLQKRIIGIADGPASFNAEMHALGKRIVSLDPIYAFRADEIEKQFYANVDRIIAQVKASPEDWVWSYHRSPERLRENRINVLKTFIADYEIGKKEGRYIIGELPRLAFANDQFDLALCSHFLFLYSDHLSYEFHRTSIYEMLRVAKEVRVFPLLTLMLEKSYYLEPLIEDLESHGFIVRAHTVGYELQRGGNQMLQVRKAA